MRRERTYDDKCREAERLQARVEELEKTLREIGKDGALGRLAAQLVEAEAARDRQKAKYAALSQQLAAQSGAPHQGVRLGKAPRGSAVPS